MALTIFQRDVCRLLAGRRRTGGESYVAGGMALNVALAAHRISRDLDLFHDTTDAVARSWDADRHLLEDTGYVVVPLRERPGFVQATVSRRHDRLLIEWIHDSAFRFFPLVEHEELGLTLHPFDLATNKVLALIGRLEVRDWCDVIACDDRLQPLGYLAWAACGKDPGFSPLGVIDHARRSSHYSPEEIASLAFEGPPPDPAELSRRWRRTLETAVSLIGKLPAAHAGEAVLTTHGELFRGQAADLDRSLASGEVAFHAGRLGGALPQIAG
ncbi:MAG: carbohydrate kinase family protein [Cyanobacteria bacterium]|nr:carbohydrate kinase family protein [Cyanobacteriota bacterium]